MSKTRSKNGRKIAKAKALAIFFNDNAELFGIIRIVSASYNTFSNIYISNLHIQVKREEWKTVFFIAAGFYLVGNLVFVIFGKAEIQAWNEVDEVVEAEKSPAQQIGEFHYNLVMICYLDRNTHGQQHSCSGRITGFKDYFKPLKTHF